MGLLSDSLKNIFALAHVLQGEASRRSLLDDMGSDIWSDADDLWPGEPVSDTPSNPPEVIPPEQEVVILDEWGLILPNGTIQWNTWNGNHFSLVTDRIKMVSQLQETANQCGHHPESFLSCYGWIRRKKVCVITLGEPVIYAVSEDEALQLEEPTGSTNEEAAQ